MGFLTVRVGLGGGGMIMGAGKVKLEVGLFVGVDQVLLSHIVVPCSFGPCLSPNR